MDEFERAAHELERRIAARQQGDAPLMPDELDAELAEFADELVAVSRSIQPSAAFVDALETRLLQNMAAPASTYSAGWQWPSLFGGFRLGSHSPLRVALAGGVLALILLLLSFPTTRAALRNLLFGMIFVEPRELKDEQFGVETPVNVAGGRPMTLAEIQAQAPFVVKTPAWLPDDLAFTGGYVVETPTGAQVSLVYHRPQDRTGGEIAPDAPYLLLVIMSGEPEAPPLLPEDEQQWVNVAGEPAIYVHGIWRAGAADKASNTVSDVYWDSAADDAWLTWREEELAYWLQADGLHFDQTTIVQVAESLTEQR
ncbi:MAG: hypothetical protein R3A44_42910 [Caldilineaceae bacterium]